MNNNLPTRDWVDKVYKKLKGDVCFDKTQIPLINQLVYLESDDLKKLDLLTSSNKFR
jgi:hypothetical protein